MDDLVEQLGNQIGTEISDIAVEELPKLINQELVGNSELFLLIKKKITDFLKKVEEYENNPIITGSIGVQADKLKLKKDFIYQDFFEIQNLINAYIGQKIVVTYVHVDENGQRELRIIDNTAKYLTVLEGNSNNNPFYKLGYNIDARYSVLKNSLPMEDNLTLQETAAEVERRYNTYKKRVLWFWGSWKGYKFSTKGPINEAFTDLYIHNIKLTSSLEGNIDTFMLGDHGAIKADATKGYMIGDVNKDGIQYAVKGYFGSPQGVKDVINQFKKMQDEDFSMSSFIAFIERYTTEEINKKYKSQIKELSKRSVSGIVRANKLETTLQINI